MKSSHRLCVPILAAAFQLSAWCQIITWDTTPSWVGSAGIDIFGDVAYGNPSFGQTFTAPSGINAMQSYTMWLDDRNNPDLIRFTAYCPKTRTRVMLCNSWA